MIKGNRLHSVVTIIILVFLFCLSWFQQISVICTLILVVAWIVSPGFTSGFKKAFSNLSLLLLISFYLLHVVSLAYSYNIQYGLFDLQTKLPFLFFPLFFSSYFFSDSEVKRFKKAFVAGAILACLICLFYAIKFYLQTGQISSFFYKEYSHFMHPAYFAIYITIAVLFLIESFSEAAAFSRSKTFVVFVITFLLSNICLLSSRTALVTAFLIAGIYLLVLAIRKGIIKKDFPYILAIIFCVAVVQYIALKMYDRFSQVTETIKQSEVQANLPQPDSSAETHKVNSTRAHYLIWKNALGVIENNWLLGVGAGDVHEELNKEFMRNSFVSGTESSFNAHNQFLNTGVALGLIGLFLLLAVILYPGWLSFRSGDWLFFFLLTVIFFNSLTESILERQAAILLFSFFFSLFAVRLKAKAG